MKCFRTWKAPISWLPEECRLVSAGYVANSGYCWSTTQLRALQSEISWFELFFQTELMLLGCFERWIKSSGNDNQTNLRFILVWTNLQNNESRVHMQMVSSVVIKHLGSHSQAFTSFSGVPLECAFNFLQDKHTDTHTHLSYIQSQGCMRIAPSSLMTSPLIMGFSASDVTRWANSAGSPRREGKGTWRARKERTFSGRPARSGVEKRPEGTKGTLQKKPQWTLKCCVILIFLFVTLSPHAADAQHHVWVHCGKLRAQ